MAAAGVVAGMLVAPTVMGMGIGPTGACMLTIRLTATIGTGITKQIVAEGDFCPPIWSLVRPLLRSLKTMAAAVPGVKHAATT
jgi:hypothetical protein